MITPSETALLRQYLSDLGACATSAAVNGFTHAIGQAWRPNDELAAAIAQLAEQHRKRLDGEIDPQTCEMQCERIVMSASGAMGDIFGGAL